MNPRDIPSAIELSTSSNWNQTPEDWRCLMQLAPQGLRCIEDNGRIVATASLLPYGTQLAWIGMVLTRREYRGRGLARLLVEDAIAASERGGIRTLKLDATDEGRPLYESLGFVVEQTIERWGRERDESAAAEGTAGAGEDRSCAAQISGDLFALDARAFGADRRELLQALSASGRCYASESGYVLSRAGSVARYLGPCVAVSEADAQQLIAVHLEEVESEGQKHRDWYWDLLPANPAAVRCATGLGFARRRILWRMRRGEAIENNDSMIYAIAGFELG